MRLPGHKGRHCGVVVLKTLDVSACGGQLGQLLVFQGAARYAHTFAAQVCKTLHVHAFGGKHGLKEGRIGGGEVDDLLALRVFAQGGDDQIGLFGLQVGNAVGTGNGQKLDGHAQFLGNVVGGVDVQALGLQIGAYKTIRRKVHRNGDIDFFRFHHIIQSSLGI